MKYFFTTLANRISITIVLAISFLQLTAQKSDVSPYTRIGLGNFNTSFSAGYSGMGNASVALSDFNLLNISNPASYSSFQKHIPVFELQGATRFVTLKSSLGKGKLNTTNFTNLAIGFPVSKRLGFVIGLLPYSTVGYNVTSNNDESASGQTTFNYSGSGGINRAFLGAGFTIIDRDSIKFSAGINASFLFGSIEKSRRISFPDDNIALNSLLFQKTRHTGLNLEFGLQYKQRVSNRLSYSLGFVFSNQSPLQGKREQLYATYTDFNSVEQIRDTLSYSSNIKGEVVIPTNIKFGAAVKLNNNLEISAQFQTQDWGAYKEDFGEESNYRDSLTSSSSFRLGVRYTPSDVFSTDSYFKKIEYRIGFRYGETPFTFNGVQLKEFGTSFGLGLPIKPSSSNNGEIKSYSTINFGVEIGKKGTTDNGLIQENFTTIYFGISISPQARNRWFVKRKFN